MFNEFDGERAKRYYKLKLKSRIQSENEDIKQYYYDLIELANIVDPKMPVSTFREYFENGNHTKCLEKFLLLSNSNFTYKELHSTLVKLLKQG